ncbi:M56 family metallopeptidase [Aminipila sp.]|uniref:M56 family metallopeptidase n=1 Tax=Aminipila sp. TaxID=2060095 RepID=UPI002897DF28|nr:M56 family metallopeptidase [Aminipila sp.]
MSLLNMSFAAAVLILAIVIIRALLLHRLPKKTFLALWGVALCRLLIPFEVSSRFSVYSVVNITEGRFFEKGLSLSGIPVMPSNTAITQTAATWPEAADINLSPFMIIWLIGFAVCAVFFLVTHLRCCKEYKTALPIDNAFVRLWQREHQMWRKIQIRQSDRISAPLTYGILRPVVLLPKQTDWTDETRLRYILTHEFVHIRRFDTLTKLVMATAFCVHWFNPVVWLMYMLANRDIELSCDETVVQTFGGVIKSAYACTLIELEEKRSHLTPLINNYSKNAIEERIVSIMKIKKVSIMGVLLAFTLVIGTITVFATNSASAAVLTTKGQQENNLQVSAVKLGRTTDENTYNQAEKAVKAVNYVPNYVESFSKGFYFKEAVVTNTEVLDSKSNKVMEYNRGIVFYYTDTKGAGKFKGGAIILSTNPKVTGLPEDPKDAVANTEESYCGDIRLIYSQITEKRVPKGYVPTEEEKQKVNQGLLYFSVGSEEVKILNLQWVKWVKDGIDYNLMDWGYGVKKDELLKMAKEVID